MTQTKLEKARTYEKEQGAQIPPEERPLFHVTPAVGWANDPNGFSVYKGTYHLFHQYYPYDIHWGPMHWGHLTSTDLIRWEYLPAALAPDAEYDEQGVFSGSAVELPDGRQLLMYTGVYGREDVAECFQAQCIAAGDGLDYKKYEKNPVITADRIPEDCSPKDFRDPKIWRDEEEGCYYAVMGMRTADGSGAVVLFSSQDGFSWDYVTVLDRCRKEYGSMWECPDFFELGKDGTAVLIVSPQEMQAKGMEFHNGNDVVGFLGHYDRKYHRFTREHVFAVDYGLDFYAPQTLKTPDGRRVLIGWMQAWENSHLCRKGAKWQGMFTLPRELTTRDGRLIQQPVRELLNYRQNPVIHKDIPLQPRTRLPGISGRILDMTVDLWPEEGGSSDRFTVRFAENDTYRTDITYHPRENTVCFDRTYSGFPHNIITCRKAPVRNQGGRLRLRILLDRFSAEIFVNDGEQVLSACIYTPQEAAGISFLASGAGRFDVEKYELAF